jgi:hypothetical protein
MLAASPFALRDEMSRPRAPASPSQATACLSRQARPNRTPIDPQTHRRARYGAHRRDRVAPSVAGSSVCQDGLFGPLRPLAEKCMLRGFCGVVRSLLRCWLRLSS